MLVDVFVFRGDARLCTDPYLRLGHIGVRFGERSAIYGFGPKRGCEIGAKEGKKEPAEGSFSVHDAVFARALARGLPVYRVRTCCLLPAKLSHRISMLKTFRFALPPRAGVPADRTLGINCVGALRYLGIELPGESLYISQIIRSVGTRHGRAHRSLGDEVVEVHDAAR